MNPILAANSLGSVEKHRKNDLKTVVYKEGVNLVRGCPGISVPSTGDIDADLLRYIVRLECGWE